MRSKKTRLAVVLLGIALITGAVFAAAAVGPGGSSSLRFGALAKGEPDAKAEKASATYTPESPAAVTAAEEAYAQRAYPADEITIDQTLGAQQAWAQVKGRANGRGKNKTGQCTMVGPSHANMPSLLVFSGADYVTSGRITALALDPACTESKCRMWIGAAGGGVWRADNALSGSPNWSFVSGSLPSNAIGSLTYDAASGTLYA